MASVTLFASLRQYTGGVTTVDLEAATIRQLFQRLAERFPDLAPHLQDGLAVAIDGQIYQDALFQPIPASAEVHILPQIAGG
jgi:molybdopterin converting factor small subunit